MNSISFGLSLTRLKPLRNELVNRYREYETKGEMSILDKENIEAMFKQYEILGGNGTVKHLMEELLCLPTKVIKS